MKWKRFDWESDGVKGAIDFLNEIEQRGYEPRTIIPWARNSAGDPIGITVYARELRELPMQAKEE